MYAINMEHFLSVSELAEALMVVQERAMHCRIEMCNGLLTADEQLFSTKFSGIKRGSFS
jgi:hypothetical protein